MSRICSFYPTDIGRKSVFAVMIKIYGKKSIHKKYLKVTFTHKAPKRFDPKHRI
jgi:hypothetical protein